MESLILSHGSALEFWRLVSSGVGFVELSDLERCRYSKDILRSTELVPGDSPLAHHLLLRQLCRPLVNVVDSPEKRSKNRFVHSRLLRGDLANGAFYKVTESIFVCSPELVFLQLMESGLVPALLAGHELCGVYTDSSIGSLDGRASLELTTAHKVREFLEKTEGCRYLKDARKAARYLKDHSASPVESKLSIEYGLPLRLGGRGFPEFELNHKTVLTPKLQELHGRAYLKNDLYWPVARLGCEYDSKEHHSAEPRLAEDAFRSAVLESMGITVFTMRHRHVFDYFEAEKYAELLRRFMHLHKRPELRFDQLEKKVELRETLYGKRAAASVLEAARYEQMRRNDPGFIDWGA